MAAHAAVLDAVRSAVSRTGRFKRFLVGGAIALTAGLAVLGSIDHTSPIWFVGIGMALMGLGVGAMMQNLVLAVQNTVDAARTSASTSASVAFFRSLGGRSACRCSARCWPTTCRP